jgi:SAM-dependent methyltransferase
MHAKADFTDMYAAVDPRAYYTSLGELDYQIPAYGTPLFRRLCEVIGGGSTEPTILDVCCSFGVNAALLNHELTMDDLREHYVAAQQAGLSREELVAADRRMFAESRRPDAVDVIGLDIAGAAVDYAVEVGLLADGVVADLEKDDPPVDVAARLADVDLVTVTGGVGYVNERTFERIVNAGGDAPPWIAALTLRWIGFDPIADQLEQYGLVTERLEGYVAPQRRFADDRERRLVFDNLADRGLRPNQLEVGGWHSAELFVTRPKEAVYDQPIDELLDGLTAGPPH